MPDVAAEEKPRWPHLTQKERVVRHLRAHNELERTEAGKIYHIGRLAARVRDLKKDGYQFDTRRDDTGKAHYSLVAEPGQAGPEEAEEDCLHVETAEDLWRALPEESLDRDYVALLARCAQQQETIGMLEDAVQPEAASDWEAAACMEGEIKVEAITDIREKLCRESPLVVEDGHRKGQSTYRLNEQLI